MLCRKASRVPLNLHEGVFREARVAADNQIHIPAEEVKEDRLPPNELMVSGRKRCSDHSQNKRFDTEGQLGIS